MEIMYTIEKCSLRYIYILMKIYAMKKITNIFLIYFYCTGYLYIIMYKSIKRLLVYIIVYVCRMKVDKEEDMAPVGYLTKYDMCNRVVLGFLTDKILK